MHVRALVTTGILLYLGFGLLLYALQRDFIYLPVDGSSHLYPLERFSSAGESIEVVVLNPGREHAVVYFGGNAESVAGNAPGFLDSLPDRTVYLVNYRGYAGSTGSPSEPALYEDALTIYDRIRDRHRGVSAIGRSLGSGVATYLASQRPIHRLVLVTPFDSILHIARDQYWFYPVSLLLKDRFDSAGRVAAIEADTLVVLAQGDEIISAKYSQRLIEAFPPSQVEVVTIDGAGHNGLSGLRDYYAVMADFIAADDPILR